MAQPLFNRETTQLTFQPLSRLLRRLIYGLNIDPDRYVALHSSHAKRARRDPRLTVSHRNNVRKAVLQEGISFKLFYFFVTGILNMDLVDMTVTVRNRVTGEKYVVSMNDPVPDEPGQLQPVPDAETEKPAE